MDLIGQQLGNYRLIRLLGEGGFAQVYLGQHALLDMQAAIKVIHTRFSERDIARFLQEARAVAHLHHAHIVRVLECALAEGGLPYLVMEYAPGGSLRQRHQDGIPLALPLIERYVEQTAAALAYAHAQKFIHRDVKPENLLIGAQGQLLLADFGYALLTPSSSRRLSLQDIGGTVAYMAPEQLLGKPRRASDQYALGVMVYEWLTGLPLFSGSVPELVAQHLYATPRPPRELVPTISPHVEEVVLLALAKDPKARFASVATFASAFAVACRATDDTPLTPRPLHKRSPATRPAPATAVAERDIMPPAEKAAQVKPLQPVLVQAARTPVKRAEPAVLLNTVHDTRLEPVRAKRGALTLPRFHLVPLHVGLTVVLLVLATGGGVLWQLTRVQQTVVTGTYVTSLGVGLGVDPVTQAVLGASDSFKTGTTVVLVVTIVGWNGYAEAQLRLGSILVATQQWQVSDVSSAPPAPQSHFSATARLTQSGHYRWEIDLTSFAGGSVPFVDGSITFQVT